MGYIMTPFMGNARVPASTRIGNDVVGGEEGGMLSRSYSHTFPSTNPYT